MWRRTIVALSVAMVVLLAAGMGCSSSQAGSKKSYGVPIDSGKGQAVQMTSLFSNTEEYLGKNVIVEGEIVEACATSGCWVLLSDSANQLFAQFYDFTIKMTPGTRVRIQGQIMVRDKTPYLAAQGLEVL